MIIRIPEKKQQTTSCSLKLGGNIHRNPDTAANTPRLVPQDLNLLLQCLMLEVWEILVSCLPGGFKYCLFSSLFGEDSQFDEHIFQRG